MPNSYVVGAALKTGWGEPCAPRFGQGMALMPVPRFLVFV